MSRTLRGVLKVARDLGVDLPEEHEYVLSRTYARVAGYDEGWSWTVEDMTDLITVLASNWAATEMIRLHKEGRVLLDFYSGVQTLEPIRRTKPVVHFDMWNGRRPRDCQGPRVEGDTVTKDHDAVTCRECKNYAREAQKRLACYNSPEAKESQARVLAQLRRMCGMEE